MMNQKTKAYEPSVDTQKIRRIAKQMIGFQNQLNTLFPERENLITQIIYALLTREHVLIHGIYGTGKSQLVNTVFEAFSVETFTVQMSKFMSEGYVIGMIDPKQARDSGEMVNRKEGTLRSAVFAELDEVLDATPALLRVMLSILNERKFKRGNQDARVNLHTAIGATNGSPEAAIRRDQELGAVLDRFIFQTEVNYLEEEDSRMNMYQNYLWGTKTSIKIDYDDLYWLSSLILDGNQITSMNFLKVYNDVLEAYKQATGIVVSDRRACKLLLLVEANALLYGRYDVEYEDIKAMRWGLCEGNNIKQHETFERVATPIIEEAKQKQAEERSKNDLVFNLLIQYKQDLPSISQNEQPQRLIELRRNLLDLHEKVTQVFPTTVESKIEREYILDTIEKKLSEVQHQIDNR